MWRHHAAMRCTHEITVELPVAEAMALFTAEGERRWVGAPWDPRYPDPARREGPGAVFVTVHDDRETFWVMVDQSPGGVRYARATPGVAAGTVAVDVVEADARHTRVAVTYDLTALSRTGAAWLADFERDYAAEIGSWEREIAAALATAH
jgi:hypothetical protein